MKNLTINILKPVAIILILLIACTEEQRIPEPLAAANVRIQFEKADDQNLNFANIANAKIVYSIFSENRDIESVELTFMYNNASTGLPEGPFDLKTYSQADFDANDGAIRNETFTSDQLAAIIGKTNNSDLNGGDSFVFSNKTTLTDGRIYPATTVNGNSNVSTSIRNNAATESFSVGWTSYVACPISANFAGDYDLSPEICSVVYDDGAGNPLNGTGPGPGGITGPVRLASLGGPIYSMTGFTMYGFPNRTINILLVCNSVLVANQSPGLSCGAGGPVLMNSAVSGVGVYDPDDNGTLQIRIDYPNPGCSGYGEGCLMTLTRK